MINWQIIPAHHSAAQPISQIKYRSNDISITPHSDCVCVRSALTLTLASSFTPNLINTSYFLHYLRLICSVEGSLQLSSSSGTFFLNLPDLLWLNSLVSVNYLFVYRLRCLASIFCLLWNLFLVLSDRILKWSNKHTKHLNMCGNQYVWSMKYKVWTVKYVKRLVNLLDFQLISQLPVFQLNSADIALTLLYFIPSAVLFLV